MADLRGSHFVCGLWCCSMKHKKAGPQRGGKHQSKGVGLIPGSRATRAF